MSEEDDDLCAGVLFAHSEHVTAGIDLVDVAQHLTGDRLPFAEGGRDPWRLDGTWTTPVVTAVHGWCMTLGIELLPASDIRVAAAGTRFSEMEVQRGLVQAVCADPAATIKRAHRIAETAAPLGVRATLESAHRSLIEGDAARGGAAAPRHPGTVLDVRCGRGDAVVRRETAGHRHRRVILIRSTPRTEHR
ncbi:MULTISPECIES: enoyl-CoA hydratase-related protein [Nocardiaceae]|uniref:Enoyl-CoA hydratase/carnithine racemase n=1 Tax=Rhodococcoides corynebacterioides TaxID=53972 RepID=A0ABS2KY51_9NOCA|nr:MULTISPECIES: enoyl-CoA hydratase-related protein [Rhodococcus]MBM7416854.1 enoyl-CoA hydratase/carnithine racemase [Rhodococcus corynebacterioides]MBP1115107.1 enoyl-CoA hydratase/carnithine racemase [Rhodococcus sp. PvP016]